MKSFLTMLAVTPLAALAFPTNTFLIRRQDSSAPVCPADTPISCSSRDTSNSCCVNTYGNFVQTQFWDASPSTGPSDSWTIHGLWPDDCFDSSFPQFCDKSREQSDIISILNGFGATDLVNYMSTYWKDVNGDDNSFYSHEYNKHGLCITTLDPACYGSSYVAGQDVLDFFNTTVALFQTLPTYDWLNAAGIVPSNDATYTLQQLQDVANQNTGYDAVWDCQNGNLNQVWWGFNSQGSLRGGSFIPKSASGKSTCPAEGISWLPKQ